MDRKQLLLSALGVKTAAIALFALSAMLPLSAEAADRALLFGVAHYPDDSTTNLPGSKNDLDAMKKAAVKFGFLPQNIMVLFDEDATKANIVDALNDWLIKGVSEGDRILIYYTGHGTLVADKNGDEEDKYDEAILPYDTVVKQGREDTLIIDDEVAQYIKKIAGHTKNIFIIFDSCHSGSATKAVGLVPKFTAWPDIKISKKSAGEKKSGGKKFWTKIGEKLGKKVGIQNKATITVQPASLQDGESSAAFLAACGDDEEALSSINGSLFTQGIYQAIERADGTITLNDLRDNAASYIDENVDNSADHFTPHLSDTTPPLAGVNLLAASHSEEFVERENAADSIPTDSALWKRLAAQADKWNVVAALPIIPDKKRYRIGDYLNLTLEIPDAGYLNVINIGASDKEPIVLFPNRYVQENRVAKGRFTLPGDAGNISLPAQSADPTLIVAFFSPNPLNLYKEGGTVKGLFAALDKAGEAKLKKAFGVVGRAGGKSIVEIVP